MENSDQTPSNCPETLAMLACRYSSLGASDLGYQIDANDVSNELVARVPGACQRYWKTTLVNG